MTIMPALFISLASLMANGYFIVYCLLRAPLLAGLGVSSLVWSLCNFYLFLYALGLITTISEWNRIACSALRKVVFTFTFPLFMFTYIPIAVVALYKKVQWVPIQHTVIKSLEQVR